jgi:trans-2,3-dihydro-3-hydroxyanthranilate isomerase
MATELEYSVVDVFAERPLEGNPLAIFHDGRGLTDEQMQALARETNLSETTFILPAEDPDADRRDGVRVRIFTTEGELPFAGHPTLGTATWLRLHHAPVRDAETVTLRLNVGPVPVQFPSAQQSGPGLYGSMHQPDPVFGQEFAPAEVAQIVGMEPSDLLPGSAPQVVSTGNPFCIVPLRSTEILGRLAIPQREAVLWLRERGIRWFYCIAPLEEGKAQWRARMQWHSGEDPATGSAAGPCIAWLVQNGLAEPDQPIVLQQGVEMMRPSWLTVQASRTDAGIRDVRVAGRTIPVAAGRFLLP